MEVGFEEADIRAGIVAGGTVLSAFIVVRPAARMEAVEYVAYLRTSWRRGYHILQTFRHKDDKVYLGRGLGRLVWLIQEEFQHRGPLVLYRAGCSELQRFVGLRAVDRGQAPDDPGPPRAAPVDPPAGWPVHQPPEGDDGEGGPPEK